ncbi:MAG: hypothetical protein ACI841_002435, partial [Planctomycetota bacterium]
VRHVETEPHQLKQGAQEALCLPERQVIDQPDGQRSFDGEVRVLAGCSTLSGWLCIPCLDRFGGDPESDVTALNEGVVVFGPVGDTVAGLVLRSGLLNSCPGFDRAVALA